MSLSLLIAATLAVSGPQDPPPTVLDDVVVEGVRRDQETSFAFVRAISAPPFGSHTMAVWTDPICLSIDNLPPPRARLFAERVAARARQVGVEVAGDGCRPNVVILFTADGPATAADMVRRSPGNFRPTSAATQGDRASLDAFTTEQRAVRWWTVNMPVDVETGKRVVALAGENDPISRNPLGAVMAAVPAGSRLAATPMRMTGGPPMRMIRGAQPIGGNIQDVLMQTIVIVDVRLAAGRTYEALGDYLAMIVLAQIDPDAEIQGAPTILNLFSETSSVAELSQWDLDYLKALYEAPVHWSHVRFQQQDIARRMAVAPAEVAP